MPRLFSAIEIPHKIAQGLSLLRGGLYGARWIDGENYHITLRFYGDVECHIADEIANSLDHIKCQPFDLKIDGLGVFGSSKPHCLYASLAPSPQLSALQSSIERKCQRLGLAPQSQKFTPHITLARLKNTPPQDVAHYLTLRGALNIPAFQVKRFVMMSARSSVGGGPYVVEESWPLNESQYNVGQMQLENV